jgi:hypothetical protein
MNCGSTARFGGSGTKATGRPLPSTRRSIFPRFGGYDAVAIARGVSVPGHPLFWTITGERLYLLL